MAGYFCRAVQSPEVVHPDSGLPYGGVQEIEGGGAIVRWVSCYRQTWSATSYLRLILHGIFGIRLTADALHFQPSLPAGMDRVELRGLPYRKARLNIVIERGDVDALFLNETPLEQDFLPGSVSGNQDVRVIISGEYSLRRKYISDTTFT